jgi:hypothetical protein
MRRSIGALVVLCTLACKGESPTDNGLRLAPPTLDVAAWTFAEGVVGDPLDLWVSVALHNHTTTHLQAVVSDACPFAVRIFPDSSGTQPYIGVVGCPPGGAELDIAPGDSAILTRKFPADTLATFAPGTYSVNVLVGTVHGSIGMWAGTVPLPFPFPVAARIVTAPPPAR